MIASEKRFSPASVPNGNATAGVLILKATSFAKEVWSQTRKNTAKFVMLHKGVVINNNMKTKEKSSTRLREWKKICSTFEWPLFCYRVELRTLLSTLPLYTVADYFLHPLTQLHFYFNNLSTWLSPTVYLSTTTQQRMMQHRKISYPKFRLLAMQ